MLFTSKDGLSNQFEMYCIVNVQLQEYVYRIWIKYKVEVLKIAYYIFESINFSVHSF